MVAHVGEVDIPSSSYRPAIKTWVEDLDAYQPCEFVANGSMGFNLLNKRLKIFLDKLIEIAHLQKVDNFKKIYYNIYIIRKE